MTDKVSYIEALLLIIIKIEIWNAPFGIVLIVNTFVKKFYQLFVRIRAVTRHQETPCFYFAPNDLISVYEVRLLKNATDVISAILINQIGVFQFLGHYLYVRTNNQCTN